MTTALHLSFVSTRISRLLFLFQLCMLVAFTSANTCPQQTLFQNCPSSPKSLGQVTLQSLTGDSNNVDVKYDYNSNNNPVCKFVLWQVDSRDTYVGCPCYWNPPGSYPNSNTCRLQDGACYVLKAHANQNIKQKSAKICFQAKPTCPGAPLINKATNTADGQVEIDFSAPVNTRGITIPSYILYRNNNKQNNVITNAGTFKVTGLSAGSHTFYLIPSNGCDNDKSNQVSVDVDVCPTAPTASKAEKMGKDGAKIIFSGSSSDGGSPVTYILYQNDKETSYTASKPDTIVVNSGLATKTTYNFQVAAKNKICTKKSNIVTLVSCPGIPDLKSVTSPAAGQVDINFGAPSTDGGSPITDYYLYQNKQKQSNVIKTAGTVTLKQLVGGTYTFYLTAYNGCESDPSKEITVKVDPISTCPGPPIINKAINSATNEVEITFKAPAKDGGVAITRYYLYRNKAPHALTITTAGTFKVPGVETGKHTFYLTSFNGCPSNPSNEVEVDVVGCPTAPSTSKAEQMGKNGAKIIFSAPSSDGGSAVTYHLYQNDVMTSNTATKPDNIVVGSGLVAKNTYNFQITAKNKFCESPKSNTVSVTIPPPDADPTRPSPPKITSLDTSSDSVTINFEASSYDGGSPIKTYTVYKDKVKTSITTSNPGRVTVSNLQQKSYEFSMTATNNVGESDQSNSMTAELSGKPGCPNISGVDSISKTQVKVKFNAPSSDGGSRITLYKLYISNSPSEYTSGVAGSMTVNVIDGQSYSFTITATNSKGEGCHSNAYTYTPTGNRPSPPTITNVDKRSPTEAYVIFSAPSDDGGSAITSYKVYIDGGATSFTATTAGRVKVTGSFNKRTKFTMTASNKIGESNKSNEYTLNGVPGAPVITRIDQNSRSQVTIYFSAPSNDGGSPITSYTSYYGSGAGPSTTTAGSIVVPNLQLKKYSFTLTATSKEGQSEKSKPYSFDLVDKPSRPSITTVDKLSDTEVLISFRAPADNGNAAIVSYQVYINGNNIGPSTDRDGSVRVSMLSPSLHKFTITATNRVGESERSNEVEKDLSKSIDTKPPGAPVLTSAQKTGSTQATLQFTAPTQDGGAPVTSYQVFIDGQATGPTSTSAGSVVVPNLLAQQYSFSVAARNSAGEGPQSNSRSVDLRTVPGAPSISRIDQDSSSQVTIYFSAPSDNGGSPIVRYQVFIDGNRNGPTTTTDGSVIVKNLSAKRYSFTISASNSNGEGPQSTPFSSDLSGVPSAPTISNIAKSEKGAVSITFSAPSQDGGSPVTSYQVYIDNSSAGPVAYSAGSVQVTGLSARKYTFTISAKNKNGESPRSNIKDIDLSESDPVIKVPGAPIISTAQKTADNEATVYFSAPEDNGGARITLYQVYVNGEAGPTTSTAGKVKVPNLVNKEYTFTMTARNSAGEGPQSNQVKLKLDDDIQAPGAPYISSVDKSGDNGVMLQFRAPASNGGSRITSYQVYINGQPNGPTTTTAGSVKVGNLSPGKDNMFTITATNKAGEGPKSNEVKYKIDELKVPDAPIISRGEKSGPEQATIYFRAPDNNGGAPITSYQVYINGEPHGPTPTSAGSVKINDLTEKEYTFAISARNKVGEGPKSKDQKVTMDTSKAPNAPYISKVDLTGKKEVTIQFRAPDSDGGARISGYQVYINGEANGPTPVQAGSVKVSNLDYKDYSFTITARNKNGESPKSNPGTIKLEEPKVPGAPFISRAENAGPDEVVLYFRAPDKNGGARITSYQVYINGQPKGPITEAPGSVQVTGLSNAKHTFSITARNSVGEGPKSNEVSADITIIPGPPQNVRAISFQDKKTTVHFKADPDGGTPSSFKATAVSPTGVVTTATGTASPIVINGLVNGQEYTITVAGINSAGEGLPSDPVTATPGAGPSAPTNVKATSFEDKKSTVSFSSTSGDSGLKIKSFSVTAQPGDISVTGTSSPIFVNGLTNGVTYTFTVKATNAVGTSPPSSPATGKPATVSDPPTITSGFPKNGNQVQLSFDPPGDNGGDNIKNYRVHYMGQGVAKAQTQDVSSSPAVLTMPDKIKYQYWITAVNGVGESKPSNLAIISLAPNISVPTPPTITKITAIGTTSVEILFTAPVNNGGGEIKVYYVMWNNEATAITTNKAGSVRVPDLPPKVNYFRIVAVNAAGDSPPSNEVSINLQPGVPGPPTITKVEAIKPNEVVIYFEKPKSNGGSPITYYQVIWNGAASGITTPKPGTVNVPMLSLQKHAFRMVAGNDAGEGYPSNEVCIDLSGNSTDLTPPTITRIKADSDSQATIFFNPPKSNGGSPIVLYRVYRNGNPTEVTTTIAGSVQVPGLASRKHAFTMTAQNKDEDESAQSNEVSIDLTNNSTAPNAPTITKIQADNATEVTIYFDAPKSNGGSPILSYHVIWNNEMTSISTPVAGKVRVTSLQPQKHVFRIIARTKAGDSPPSNEVSIDLTPQKPNPPVITRVEPSQDKTKATLYFTAPKDVGSNPIQLYRLYINGILSDITTTKPGSIVATGLSTQVYSFFITAVSKGGESPPSNIVELDFSIKVVRPGAPTITKVIRHIADGVTIAFTQPIYNGGANIDSYHLYVDGKLTDIKTIEPGTMIVSGLAEKTYSFTVSARNRAGEGPQSAAVKIKIANPPGVPSIVSMNKVSTRDVNINFKAPQHDGGDAIILYHLWVNGVRTSQSVRQPDVMEIKGLTPNFYVFAISCSNGFGESHASEPVSIRIADIPSAPDLLRVSSDDAGKVTVYFGPPSYDGGEYIHLYQIYINGARSSFTSTRAGSIQVTGLKTQPYTFTMTALNSAGESVQSKARSIDLTEVPGPPVITKLESPSKGELIIYFDAPQDNGGANIQAYTTFMDFVRTEFVSTQAGKMYLSGLSLEVHTFTIAAKNRVGEGPPSNAVTIDIGDPQNLDCTCNGAIDEDGKPMVVNGRQGKISCPVHKGVPSNSDPESKMNARANTAIGNVLKSLYDKYGNIFDMNRLDDKDRPKVKPTKNAAPSIVKKADVKKPTRPKKKFEPVYDGFKLSPQDHDDNQRTLDVADLLITEAKNTNDIFLKDVETKTLSFVDDERRRVNLLLARSNGEPLIPRNKEDLSKFQAALAPKAFSHLLIGPSHVLESQYADERQLPPEVVTAQRAEHEYENVRHLLHKAQRTDPFALGMGQYALKAADRRQERFREHMERIDNEPMMPH